MKKEYSLEEIRYKAAAYCSLTEHCESEVRTKLNAWGMREEVLQNKIIDYLYDEKYLSEERYCRAFVNDKLRFQKWGRIKIRAMLQQKRLSADCIREAIDTINEEEYLQILKEILAKKAKILQHETPEICRTKLLYFAASRGFSYNEVEKILE